MNIENLFNDFGVSATKVRYLTETERQTIISMTTILDEIPNIKIGNRLKFLKYGNGKIQYCRCGMPCALSPHFGEVFKATCGSALCAAHYKRSERAVKGKLPSTQEYDIPAIKNYLISLLDTDAPTYATFNMVNPFMNMIRGMKADEHIPYNKSGEIAYRIVHDRDLFSIDKCHCGSNRKLAFLGYKNGYMTRCKSCSTISAESKSKNSLSSKISLLSDKFEFIEAYSINEAASVLKCRTCGHIDSYWLKNGRDNKSCIKCFPRTKSSYEFEIIDFIKSIGIENYIHSHRMDNGKEIDIYLPEYSLGIEINGIFWHSNDRRKHIDKLNYANSIGIDLIQFTDIEWVSTPEICQSIIKSRLRLNQTRIFARKCIIRDIDNVVYKNFCQENHISGYAAASIRKGLFYGNELVAVAGFSKPRFSKADGYLELVRFCLKMGTSVIGGLSKVMKSMHSNILSYCDLSKFNGHGYETAGFSLIRQTPPNYVYYRNGKIYSRIKFQKHKLSGILENFDPKLTEAKNMEENGYSRYYDCGNKVYLWNLPKLEIIT